MLDATHLSLSRGGGRQFQRALHAGWVAIRPKTLWASVCPVAMGTAMAYGDGWFNPLTACLALLGALLLQIGCNLANDYFDYKKGADTADRVGPLRATQGGLLSPVVVWRAALVVLLLAGSVAALLTYHAGWPVAVIGAVSIACAVLYTAGPYALAYRGLGDVFVFVFFGPVAVAGSYFVQAHQWNLGAVLLGAAIGFLSMAVLVVNNLRDIETDALADKKTLAVRWGARFARIQYVSCLLLSVVIPVGYAAAMRRHYLLLALLAVPVAALPSLRLVLDEAAGEKLNLALAGTAKLLIVFASIASLAWLV